MQWVLCSVKLSFYSNSLQSLLYRNRHLPDLDLDNCQWRAHERIMWAYKINLYWYKKVTWGGNIVCCRVQSILPHLISCFQVVPRDALPSAGWDGIAAALRGKLPRPTSLPCQQLIKPILRGKNQLRGKRQGQWEARCNQSGKWKLFSKQPRLGQDGLQPGYQVCPPFFTFLLHMKECKCACWILFHCNNWI